jgi:large conductance mechanosensitive channel
MIKDFIAFVREQGIVALAVGIAIGIQASNFVGTLVDQFINPIVGIILQGTDLTRIQSEVTVNDEVLVFGWGIMLQALITLIATAFVIYFIVKKTGLDKADKK